MNSIFRSAGWLAGLLAASSALAQHAGPPVKSDLADPTVPPVAQPVDSGSPGASPVAQPVGGDDGGPPVARPVEPPASPSDGDAAPVPAAGTGSEAAETGVPAAPPATGGLGLTVVSAAAARFQTATMVYNAGQYAEAVRQFTDFIRTFPQDRRQEEALYHLAESYRQLGRTNDALAAYTYQADHFPEGAFRPIAELRRGAMLFDQKKLVQALAPLQFAVDHSDGALKQAAQFLLGRADLATQKGAEGEGLLQQLANQQPPGQFSGNAAETLAEAADAQNQSSEAATWWQKASDLLPTPAAKASAAARGGWAALTAKQLNTAESLFQKARQLDGAGAVRQIANTGELRILFSQKRFAEWLKLYLLEKGDVLPAAREEVLYDFAHTQFSLKHWPEAVAAFDAYLHEFGTQPAAGSAAYERLLAAVQADPTQILTQGDSYLKAWPQTPYRARVLLLEAQELSRQKNYAQAAPLWDKLAAEPTSADWPRREILLERARAYDELRDWPRAAAAYRALIDEGGNIPPATLLSAEARMAVALQNAGQSLAATDAWKAVQAQAPAGSPDQEAALESLGLIYAHAGPSQAAVMAQTFRALLEQFPQTKLRALAAFTVGDYLFQQQDYAGAEPYLANARSWDATSWNQAATQRLALGAYGRKDWGKLLGYVQEYDAIPGAASSSPLPAALFYALAENERKDGNLPVAEESYRRVTRLADAGDLLAGAWWQLGEVQSAEKEWAAAVTSYEKYEQLKPEAARATTVLLAMGRAQLGAGHPDAAKATAQQALLQEPEGPHSADARMLLGEADFALGSYGDAARAFATLAVLFENSTQAPQAMARAADAFEKGRDAKSAAEWREKLRAKFPKFEESSFLGASR